MKADDNKTGSASGLIQYDNKSELPDPSTKAQTERGSSIQSPTVQKTYNPPSVNSVEYLLFELSGLSVGSASENPSSNTASLTVPATLSTSPVASSPEPLASSTEPVVSSVVPPASSTPVASSTVPKASNEPVTSSTDAATTVSALTPRISVTPSGEAAVASSTVGNAPNHPFSSVHLVSWETEEKKVQTTQRNKPSASPAGTNSSTSPQCTPTFEAFPDQVKEIYHII